MIPSVKQVEMIEDIPLGESDRWYILLALMGLKKGSWLFLASDIWREGDEPIRIPQEQIDRIVATLKVLGISYRLRFRDSDAGLSQPDEPSDFRRRYNQLCDIYIGSTEEIAVGLAEAVEVMDHKRIGTLLDYPETAVAVFGTDEAVFPEDMPNHTLWTCAPYVWFRLSRHNFDEEMAVVQRWFDAVTEHSELLTLELRRKK